MIVFPLWMLKYIFAIGGFALFFSDGEFSGLVLGIVGIIWIILSRKDKK